MVCLKVPEASKVKFLKVCVIQRDGLVWQSFFWYENDHPWLAELPAPDGSHYVMSKNGRFRIVPASTPIPIPPWHSDCDGDNMAPRAGKGSLGSPVAPPVVSIGKRNMASTGWCKI